MHPILSTIFPQDIYKDFAPIPESITGWGGTSPIFEKLIRKVKPRVIIEVGTWKGQSAITMADACKAFQLDCPIICVDTWLGSEENIFQSPEDLRRQHGFPMLYFQFLSNVVHRGHQDRIVPFATTSITAAKVLKELNITADLIYIDANHQYESVLTELRMFSPLLSPAGILFGHDYFFPTVKQAVVDYCNQTRRIHTSESGFWILS